jgi:hypothetical protein
VMMRVGKAHEGAGETRDPAFRSPFPVSRSPYDLASRAPCPVPLVGCGS